MIGDGDRPDWRDACDLTAEFVEQWRELYRNSLSPNIYLSPDFVLTALATFYRVDAKIVSIASGDVLQALAVVEHQGPSPRFPLRSHKLFKPVLGFQSGVLLRRGIGDAALDEFVRGLLTGSASCLYLHDFCLASDAADKILESASRQSLIRYETQRYERAALRSGITLEAWKATISSKKVKEVARLRRRLGERGDLDWRLVRAVDVTDDTVETFLKLEHDGWKGDRGESLLSNPEQTEFFRRVVSLLKERDEVFFAELLLDNAVVASTANFKSRDTAFAFKVGWRQSLAKFSPGILNEVFFVEYVAGHPAFFNQMDSGATGDSFINAYWPDRLPMFRGYLLRGWHLRILTMLLTLARGAKRTVRGRLSKAQH